MPSRTSSGRFSRLLPHTELRLVFPRNRTSGFGALSKDNSRILTSASSEISGFCGSPVPSFFIVSGAHHVLDGYEPPGARALDRREVYAQLFRSTLGGVCGPRLLGFASLRGLPGGVLRILRRVAHRLLGLLGGPFRGVLRLPRDLSGLLGSLAGRVLHALDGLSGLVGGLSGYFLGLARCLAGRVLGLLG